MNLSVRQQNILSDRYIARNLHGESMEESIQDVWKRVASAIASDEDEERAFLDLLDGFKFVPGGRILAGAGLGNRATMGNCYVLPIEDTREGIFHTLGVAMDILSKGGGVGINFSPLRPKGSPLMSSRGIASGPTSFATVFNAAAHTIVQGGSRRAAMMFCINIDHPDAMEFVTYKQRMITDLNLRKWKGSREAAMEIWPWYHANVSACLTSSFHKALQDGTTAPILDHTGKKVGEYDPDERLRELAYYAWASGDPGIINLHAVNQLNNTAYFETIESTNPCGEIPLPPYGVCFLGSVNLAIVDEISQEMADTIVRFMDNVVSLNYYPYDACRQRGMISRRIGIGFMGLAERLVKDNIVYGSPESIEYVKALYMDLRDKLYTASVKLSKERGPFPAFARAYLERPFIQRLPAEIRKDIARYGIRNACLMTQAPTGTTSALAGTSSGIEPYFAAYEIRTDGTGTYQVVHPYAGHPAFITASEIAPEQHVLIQAAAQEFIDQAISKTINLPENATVDDVYAVYRMAIRENLKGITVYRDNCTGLQVIQKPRCPECGHGTIINAGCQECPHCGWSVCAN